MSPAEKLLAAHFAARGYIRRPNPDRLSEGHYVYKKGTEVRLVVDTRAELAEVRAALREVGFKPGRPFDKGGQIVQPIYGAAAADWFERTS